MPAESFRLYDPEIIVGTKQTVERTVAGVQKLDPEYEGPAFFSSILLKSVEDGMGYPSPSLLKANLEAAGLKVVGGERHGVNVSVEVQRLDPRLNDDGIEVEQEVITVLAFGRAPSGNEALLLAVCAEVRTELAEASKG